MPSLLLILLETRFRRNYGNISFGAQTMKNDGFTLFLCFSFLFLFFFLFFVFFLVYSISVFTWFHFISFACFCCCLYGWNIETNFQPRTTANKTTIALQPRPFVFKFMYRWVLWQFYQLSTNRWIEKEKERAALPFLSNRVFGMIVYRFNSCALLLLSLAAVAVAAMLASNSSIYAR